MTRALPWILSAVLLAVVGGLCCALHRAQTVATEHARLAEAERLRAAGVPVVEVVTDEELAARVVALEALLAEPLERVRRVSPGARPVAVLSASTGPVVAQGDARSESPTGGGGIDDLPPSAPPSPCLVAAGDLVELHADEVHLETRTGTRVVVGEISAWREMPAPRSRIARGYLVAPLTEAATVEAPRLLAGWGVGGAVLGTVDGLGLGLAVAAPPVTLWGVSLEPTLVAGWGSGGPVATLAVIGRR